MHFFLSGHMRDTSSRSKNSVIRFSRAIVDVGVLQELGEMLDRFMPNARNFEFNPCDFSESEASFFLIVFLDLGEIAFHRVDTTLASFWSSVINWWSFAVINASGIVEVGSLGC